MVSGVACIPPTHTPRGSLGWGTGRTCWTGRAWSHRLLQLGAWKMSAEWVWGKYSRQPFLPHHPVLRWG